MKKKIVRIKDIAEKAQTSKGTVDRVLHNRGRVAEDVRERILKIIKELNYEPNLIAQSLKSQRTFNIAALIPDSSEDSYWEAPLKGIEKAEKELRQYGINITRFIFNPHDEKSFILKAKEATKESPDGVLIAPIFYKEALPFFANWKSLQIPYVLFNTQIESVDPLCYIGQDSYRSGFLAAKILSFGLPYPCTVLVAHINEDIPNSAHLITKEKGFRDYFLLDGRDKKYKVVSKDINFIEGGTLDAHLEGIQKEETELAAVYVTNSKAFEVASYLERSGKKEIKLVGYDLLPSNLEYLNKEIINFLINQNPLGQGYWGIHQLANHLIFKKDIQPIKFLPLDIITKENLDYYLDPQ
ncbi:substrate-binding domain-containing protein [Dyadobacter psychrotolerans]|uniref:LacI family DNA-binding transcriptional regulator n=1 Tax=Dyadobacter psychrotolerans TaxID=2541721 RepID=A0A4R5E0F6_9BACT|nr:substrate-binding domain-containing protein [Dyadobacter psychrotolerans]TDE18484.1 LacI family DNA-binding transcriptional regulator [Dyadobacter psychrotolerans]